MNLHALTPKTKRRFSVRDDRLDYRVLEARRLLAGNVLFFEQGSFVRVVGDELDNIVEVSQNEAGQTVVTGVDTTVNGFDTPQVLDNQRSSNISIALRQGNDSINVLGLNVAGHTRLIGEDGDDRITTDGLTSRYLHVEGRNGNDVVQLINSSINKSTYVYLGEGNDVLAADSFVSGRNFKVYGDNGNDTFAAGEFQVGRKFRLNLGNGNDDALLAGQAEVVRSTKIRTGDGDDFVGILPDQNGSSINFLGRLVVKNGSGDDTTALDESVDLRTSNRINGGSGFDAIEIPESTDNDFRSNDFETTGVSNLQELVDRVFDTLNGADIESDFFESSPDIELLVSASNLNFNEGGDPVAIDGNLEIAGPAGQQFNGASVSIDPFVSGQDILSFEGINGISGQFDSDSGTLSLTGEDDAAAYQAALRNVFYENTSDNPILDERRLNISLVTATNEITASRPLQVVGVNNAPIVELSRSSVTVTAVATPAILDDQVELTDVDSPTLNSAIVSITEGFESGIDQLVFAAQSGIIGTFDPFTGALTLAGDAAIETYELVLRSVAYEALSQPDEVDRNLRITINDGELTGFDELRLELDLLS